MSIRTLDNATGRVLDDLLAVRYGATADDWERVADEKSFVELLDGRLIMHSAVFLTHARLFNFLHLLLAQYVERRGLGEVLAGPFAMDLGPDRKFEPDLMYLTPQTAKNLREDRLSGPADLVIEIASPSTRAYDRGEKRACYAESGVREYWMVDPDQRVVTVDQPAGQTVDTLSSGPVISRACDGFWIRAEWLWADPTPEVLPCLEQVLRAGPS